MIDLKKACEIASNNNPNMKIISCVEQSNIFVFNMLPKDINGEEFANGSVYTVDKNSGEFKEVYFMMVANNKKLNEYDDPKDFIF